MCVLGNTELNTALVPLLGRTAFYLELKKSDGTPFTLSAENTVSFFGFNNADDAIISAAYVLTQAAGQIHITDGGLGRIYVELTDAAIATLNVQRLAYGVVQVDDYDATIVFTGAFTLIPLLQAIQQEFPMSVLLSLRFVNSLQLTGRTGGSGTLEAVSTLNQAVGVQVDWVAGGTGKSDVLEIFTDQVCDGVLFTQPLDFDSVSNRKVWRTIE